MADDLGLGQKDVSGGDEKRGGSGSLLKEELSGFDGSQDRTWGMREREDSMVMPRFFSLSSF